MKRGGVERGAERRSEGGKEGRRREHGWERGRGRGREGEGGAGGGGVIRGKKEKGRGKGEMEGGGVGGEHGMSG